MSKASAHLASLVKAQLLRNLVNTGKSDGNLRSEIFDLVARLAVISLTEVAGGGKVVGRALREQDSRIKGGWWRPFTAKESGLFGRIPPLGDRIMETAGRIAISLHDAERDILNFAEDWFVVTGWWGGPLPDRHISPPAQGALP